GGAPAEGLVDRVDEAALQRRAPLQRDGPRRVDLDQQDARERRIAGQRVEVRAQAALETLQRRAVLGAGRVAHGAQHALDRGLEGGDEALLLGGELLV